jgi:TPP-dependent pyruvate/acetoin dehydrogenase alpha subunit
MIEQIENEVNEEADSAVEFAKNAAYPDESEVTLHVFA